MKLQMMKMVKDLNTNQDRTSNAREILNDLNAASNAEPDQVFAAFDASVEDFKDDGGLEIMEARSEIRDMFARLENEKKLMEEDINDMMWEQSEMQTVVTKMGTYVDNFEAMMGQRGMVAKN